MAATGYKNSAGVDLDDLFEPVSSGSAPSTVVIYDEFLLPDGGALRLDYCSASFGTPAADTGLAAGIDGYLNKFTGDMGSAFAAVGSVSTAPNVANVADFTVTATDFTFSYTARADVVIDSTGYFRRAQASNTTNRGTLTNHALYVDTLTGFVASEFEVKCDIVSGTLTGGDSTGTWLTCNAEQNWYKYIQSSNPAPQTVVLDITIREVANTANTDTCRVTLTAQGAV